MRYTLVTICSLLLASCWTKKPIPVDPSYQLIKRYAWKPVYGANEDYKKITWINTPRAVTKAGKIYVLGNRIYQNDIGTGIHVIDNSIPAQAKRIAFIEIGGNTELAIKGNSLFANNFMDIVEIDISNPAAPQEKSRIRDAFDDGQNSQPYVWQAPADSGFYLCPKMYLDSLVVKWEKDSVFAGCYKN